MTNQSLEDLAIQAAGYLEALNLVESRHLAFALRARVESSRTSAPIVAPEVDQHDPVCCAKYMRGGSVPEGAHECGDIPWCRRCAWCVTDADADAPAATVAPQQSQRPREIFDAGFAVGHAQNPNAFCLACNEHPCNLIAAPASPAALRDEFDQKESINMVAERVKTIMETTIIKCDLKTIEDALNSILLDLADMDTANAPMSPSYCRETVGFVGKRVGSAREAVARIKTVVDRASATTPPSTLAKAAQEIANERARQVAVEGWTVEHDDEHEDGELARAANCYRLIGNGSLGEFLPDADQSDAQVPTAWPWDDEWWKPKTRLRNLIRAGALYQAEIERLIRARDRVTEEAQCLIDKTT